MKIHIVQKGDTLWTIAKKYNVDFNALKSLNNQLSNPDMIYPGMKIKIPSATMVIDGKETQHVKEKQQVPITYIKEQSVKEQPVPIKEQPISMVPIKEQPVEIIEQASQPTNIHQDIYQIDMVTILNSEKEKPQPKPQPKPTPVVPKKPAPQLVKPESKVTSTPMQKPMPIPEPAKNECPIYMKEVACEMPKMMPCAPMPYPYMVPCLPMPMPSCWAMPAYAVPQPLAIQESDYGCQILQQPIQSCGGVNQSMPPMHQIPSMPMQQSTSSVDPMMSMPTNPSTMAYPTWGGGMAAPYMSPATVGTSMPYVPTPRNEEQS